MTIRVFGKACFVVVVVCALCRSAKAQQPQFTTVCAIAKEPAAFTGKIVSLRAAFRAGIETVYLIEPDESCKAGLWYSEAPEHNKGSSLRDERDEELQKQTPVLLQKDDGYRSFSDAVSAVVYPRAERAFCEGCFRYDVTATFTGRVDYAGEEGLGFGHMNGARLRFVVMSVRDVSTVERVYDWEKYSRTPIIHPHATLKGRVTSADGHPAEYAKVEAIPLQEGASFVGNAELSKQDGTFSIEVKPGRYLLVVNRDSPAMLHVPMDTTYFPSESRREKAEILDVVDGQIREGLDIRPGIPLRLKHLSVFVTWADGKPVEEANVMLAEESNPYAIAGDDDGGVRHTDKSGIATLTGFEEHIYRVEANIYKKPGYVPHCENAIALPKDFPDGLRIHMVLRRQDEKCRGQWDEPARPLAPAMILESR